MRVRRLAVHAPPLTAKKCGQGQPKKKKLTIFSQPTFKLRFGMRPTIGLCNVRAPLKLRVWAQKVLATANKEPMALHM